MFELLCADVAVPPQEVGGIPTKQLMYYIGGGLLALAAVMLVFKLAFGKKKTPKKKTESGLSEDLAEYPPPPNVMGSRQLTVSGISARVRLVVVAPAGNAMDIGKGQVAAVLERVIPGCEEVLDADRPRRRVWPAQPSVRGFLPKFTRHVVPPEDGDDADRWVLVCGPGRIGKRSVLIGLALLADEPLHEEIMEMEPEDWKRVVRVERV